MSTLYNVLGLTQGASHEQVKAAFRRLARRFHPDVNAGSDIAEQRFKEVSQAYETLADPDARADYDRALVCQAAEVRQRRWNFAATAAVSFALTASSIGFALWWVQAARGPQPAQTHVSDAVARGEVAGAQEVRGEVAGAQEVAQVRRDPKVSTAGLAKAALPQSRARGAGWVSYHNALFRFSLKYPADVFAYDVGPSDANVRTFVSRDGAAMLQIFAADNFGGTTLARYRRSRMEERYGAVFDQMPQHRFGFVLSGTLGDWAFYERVTFSCDGRAIHGWQMIFPVSHRTLYDLVADEMSRIYTQRTRLGAPCR
jgi:curved DNA-binding protein CbpA